MELISMSCHHDRVSEQTRKCAAIIPWCRSPPACFSGTSPSSRWSCSRNSSCSLESEAGVLPRVYSTEQRPHGVEPQADQLECDPGRGGFVRTGAIDDHLAAAPALFGVLQDNLEGHGAGNDSVAHPTRARPRVYQQQLRAALAQTIELLNGDAAHTQLLKELMTAPELQRQEDHQQRENQQ